MSEISFEVKKESKSEATVRGKCRDIWHAVNYGREVIVALPWDRKDFLTQDEYRQSVEDLFGDFWTSMRLFVERGDITLLDSDQACEWLMFTEPKPENFFVEL